LSLLLNIYFTLIKPNHFSLIQQEKTMDRLSVNTLFLSAASPMPTRRFSLVPPFTKSTPSSPSTTPNSLRRKSMIESAAVSYLDDDDDNNDNILFVCLYVQILSL
jgi:hypothetical protein